MVLLEGERKPLQPSRSSFLQSQISDHKLPEIPQATDNTLPAAHHASTLQKYNVTYPQTENGDPIGWNDVQKVTVHFQAMETQVHTVINTAPVNENSLNDNMKSFLPHMKKKIKIN